MKSREFCFWLQGLFELGNPGVLNAEQTALVKEHLALVFRHDIGADGTCDHPAPKSTAPLARVIGTGVPLRLDDNIFIC